MLFFSESAGLGPEPISLNSSLSFFHFLSYKRLQAILISGICGGIGLGSEALRATQEVLQSPRVQVASRHGGAIIVPIEYTLGPLCADRVRLWMLPSKLCYQRKKSEASDSLYWLQGSVHFTLIVVMLTVH